nr:unnamed protein product [Callosobruchus chinensis]
MSTITGNSLVIIDELCRSTSVEEGTALAIAIVEKLLQSSAFIYITTHFVLLTKLYDMYPNVKMSFKLHYKYSLLPGVTSVRQYGVYIVRNIWPDYVIKWVDEILEKIAEKPKEFRMTTLDPKCRLKYTIESEFRRLKQKQQLTVSAINELLIQYQNELSKLGYNINIQPFADRNLQRTQSLQLDEDFCTGMYVEENNAEQEQAQEAILSQSKWEQVFTPEPSLCDGVPQDSQYGQLSRFIAEDPQNVYKLMPEISIYENQENLFPNPPRSPERTVANDSCLRTLMGTTSTPLVQRQILNDENDFGEIEQPFKPNVYKEDDQNFGLQDTEIQQALPKSTVAMIETLTGTHKQCNNIPEFDLDEYNAFAAHISTLPVDENQKDVDQQEEGIEEEHVFEDLIKRGHKAKGIQSGKTYQLTEDNTLQLSTETLFQNNDPRPRSDSFGFGKFVYEDLESCNPNDIELEDSTKMKRSTKQEKIEDCAILPIEEQNEGLQTKDTHIIEENMERMELQESKQSQWDKSVNRNKNNTFAKPNTYKYYYSPVTVNIIEGPNIKTLSIDEDDSGLEEVYVQPGKIDVLEHIVVTPRGTIISNVKKVQQQKTNEDVSAQKIEEDLIKNNFNGDNQEVEVNASAERQEIEKEGYDEDKNKQTNFEIILSPKGSRQEPEIDKEYSFNPTAEEIMTGSDDNEFKSSEYEKKEAMGMGETVAKLIDHLDQSAVSFKSLAEEASEYESAHAQSTFKLCVPTPIKPSEKSFSRFFSCDDAGVDDQMNGIGGFEHHHNSMDKSFAKVDIHTERNEKGDEENAKLDEEHSCGASNIQKQSTPGVSYASKLRNLDSPTEGKSNETRKRSSPATSISSASKKRNLDQATTSSSIEQQNTSTSTTPCKSSSERKDSDADKYAASESSPNVVTPPRKLTAKEIREEFERQDHKLIEFTNTTTNSSDMSKYLERLMNRPTVQEVQNTTHLALIRKTDQGPEVIPAEAKKYKKRRKSPLRRNFSNENIDLSIFSDKNAECFEKYLGSNETDYSSFKFNFQESKKTETVFKFAPTEMKSGEYTERSITMAFMRKASDEAMERTQNSRPMFTPLKPFNPHNQTLTPDGYFKRNKMEITNLLSKYRQQASLQELATGGEPRKNIFESSDSIHCDDLNL